MNKQKVISIVGARPQFIKASAICRAVKNSFEDSLDHLIVHTGQHYDENMSGVFFGELEIPHPAYNLEIGSGSHGYQVAEMTRGIEQILFKEKPGLVIVYGDTNSTLAGALAASKIHIPVAHIEAGLRSFNKSMPEEINRVMTDHVSTFLFTPTKAGIENLAVEGFRAGSTPPFSIDHPAVFHCGDVMYDNTLHYSRVADTKSSILNNLDICDKDFILVTIHRENNTGSIERLTGIIKAIDDIGREYGIVCVLPMHPRTKKILDQIRIGSSLIKNTLNPLFIITSPLSYFDTIVLEKNCRMIITDSGGVQKESFFFRKPCLVLRPESEWKELIEIGTARLVDADPERIKTSFREYYLHPPENFPSVYGDGKASEFILGEIVKFLGAGLQE